MSVDGGEPVFTRSVQYGAAVANPGVPASPKPATQVFQKWVLAEAIRRTDEDGNPVILGEGLEYDFNTPVTSEVKLKAQWAHRHDFRRVPLKEYAGDRYTEDQKDYHENLHVVVCGDCGENTIEAHAFVDGKCTLCGMEQPNPKVYYNLRVFVNGGTKPAAERKLEANERVSTYAPSVSGYKFDHWEIARGGSAKKVVISYSTYIQFSMTSALDFYAVYTENRPEQARLELNTSLRSDTCANCRVQWRLPPDAELQSVGILTSTNRG